MIIKTPDTVVITAEQREAAELRVAADKAVGRTTDPRIRAIAELSPTSRTGTYRGVHLELAQSA